MGWHLLCPRVTTICWDFVELWCCKLISMLELRFCSEFGYWHKKFGWLYGPCSIGSSGSTVFRMRIIALYSGGKRMEYISISEDILEDEFR